VVKNKTGKNIGLRSIWFNSKLKNKAAGLIEEYCKPQWEKYIAIDFSRILDDVNTPLSPAQLPD